MNESKSGDSSLRDWFGKSKSSDGKPGWVQLGGKYAGKPCAKQPGQKTKPKCGSSKMKRNLNKKEEDAAFRRKQRQDPNPDRKGKAINVKTEERVIGEGFPKVKGTLNPWEDPKTGKSNIKVVQDKNVKGGTKEVKSTDLKKEEVVLEKKGEKDACYHKVKSRYSVWPSAYASGALVKCRKVGAANWGNKTKKEEFEPKEGLTFQQFQEKCWKGYEKKGMKTMFGKRYPNCVKKEEVEISEIHSQAHTPHEVPSKNLKKLVSKAVKRIDTDVDGDTDHNDKAKGELGEFIPGVGNKRLFSTTKTKTAKEDADLEQMQKDAAANRDRAAKAKKNTVTRGSAAFAAAKVADDVKKAARTGPQRHKGPRTGVKIIEKPAPTHTKTGASRVESYEIDAKKHRAAQRDAKIGNLARNTSNPGEKAAAEKKSKGPKMFGEDWQKVNKSDKTDGMSQKAVNAYRRENPGSKLKTAVTGDPKPGSKDAKRRKSFCSRSDGQRKMHNIDCSKTPDKAICKARRRWKC